MKTNPNEHAPSLGENVTKKYKCHSWHNHFAGTSMNTDALKCGWLFIVEWNMVDFSSSIKISLTFLCGLKCGWLFFGTVPESPIRSVPSLTVTFLQTYNSPGRRLLMAFSCFQNLRIQQCINSLQAASFGGHICILLSFFYTEMAQLIESFLMEDKDLSSSFYIINNVAVDDEGHLINIMNKV